MDYYERQHLRHKEMNRRTNILIITCVIIIVTLIGLIMVRSENRNNRIEMYTKRCEALGGTVHELYTGHRFAGRRVCFRGEFIEVGELK